MLQRDQFFVQEFQDLIARTNKKPPYTKYDLYEFLNESVQHIFDEDLAEELFNRMTKNEREEFTFNELIRVYLEAETLLIKQIEECSSRMMILSQERDQLQKKYDEAFHNERNDERGISNENFIKLNFEKIMNKGANNSAIAGKLIYISISFDDGLEEIFRSAPFYMGSYENYLGSQAIILKNLDSSITHISIYLKTDESHLGTYQFGKIVLNLENYADQLEHLEQKIFMNKQNQIIDISLEFSIVWHFSLLRFYSDGLMKWGGKMEYEEDKLNFLKKKLNSMYEPLRMFDSKRKVVLRPNERPYNPNERNKNVRMEIQKKPEPTTLHKITRIILIFYLIIAALTCWMRAEFFDIGIGMILLLSLESFNLDRGKIKLSLLVLLYMILLDFAWMMIFRYDSWVNTNGQQSTNPEYLLKYFSLILSYIILLYKVLIAFMLNKISNGFPEEG